MAPLKISIYETLFILFMQLIIGNALGGQLALVVIDMQSHFATRANFHTIPENSEKLRAVVERQVQLIRLAIAESIPILMVEYEEDGPTVDVLQKELNGYSNQVTFLKNRDGLFDDKRIDQKVLNYLKERNVSHLVVAGANGGFCVQCTIHGALRRGFDVVADPYSIADFNYKKFIYPYTFEKGTFEGADHRFLMLDQDLMATTIENPYINASDDKSQQPVATIASRMPLLERMCSFIKESSFFGPFRSFLFR